jgi:spore coat protein U-like protein
MKLNKKWIAAACASAATLMSGVQAADNHSINVSATVAGQCRFNTASTDVTFNLDPSSLAVATQTAAIAYRCTKGTTPAFVFTSASTSSGVGGNLGNGTETIPYTFTTSAPVDGTGLGPMQDKTMSVDVSVNQMNAANVTPDTYTDTIAITLNP